MLCINYRRQKIPTEDTQSWDLERGMTDIQEHFPPKNWKRFQIPWFICDFSVYSVFWGKVFLNICICASVKELIKYAPLTYALCVSCFHLSITLGTDLFEFCLTVLLLLVVSSSVDKVNKKFFIICGSVTNKTWSAKREHDVINVRHCVTFRWKTAKISYHLNYFFKIASSSQWITKLRTR